MSRPHPARSGRPIMELLDMLGRRWALRILWELREAPLTFRELQQACGEISPTVANTRLKELMGARIVAPTAQGYALTPAGRELFALLEPLNEWSKHWAAGGDQPAKTPSHAKRRA